MKHVTRHKYILILFLLMISSCDKKVYQQTEFVAFTMSQFTHFVTTNRDEKYDSLLEATFGVSASQVDDVISYVKKTGSRDNLEADVNFQLLMNTSKMKPDPKHENIDDFMMNVLTPYLWRSRNEHPVTRDIELLIDSRFIEYFGLTNGQNSLKSMLSSFDQYQNGGYFNIESFNNVNEAIRPSNYYLKFDPESKYVCLFSIDKNLLSSDVSSSYEMSVYLLSRKIPCVLPTENGISYNGSKDVVVYNDKLEDYAKSIVKSNLNNSNIIYSDIRSEQFWKTIGLSLDLSKANRIINFLDKHEFGNMNESGIVSDLIYEVAIHEAKHKYDEHRGIIRINWDNEVSAHLTEVIYSNSPYHSLKEAIQRIESFAHISNDPKMIETTKSLWDLAAEIENEPCDKNVVRNKAYQIYREYLTYDYTALPDVIDFEKDIVTSLWNNIYTNLKS